MKKLKEYVLEHKLFFIIIPLLLLITRFDFEGYAVSVTPFGVPLDDAYIGFQFARNFAQGRVLEYNPGEHTTGASTLLWVLVMALVYNLTFYLFPNYVVAFLVISKVVATLFYFLALVGVYYLAEKYYFKSKWSGLVLCSFLSLEYHLIWGTLSGMEMSLFAALIVWMLIAHREKKPYAAAVLGGLIGLTRPEGLVVFPGTILLLYLFKTIRTKKLDVKRGKRILIQLAIFAAIITPWPILNFLYSGKPLPATFYMKGGETSLSNFFRGFPFVIQVLELFGRHYYLSWLFIGGAVLYFALKKKVSPGALLAFIFMFVYGVAIPNLTGFGRYYMPVFPVIILVAFYLFRFVESITPSKSLKLSGTSFRLKKLAPALVMIIPLVIILNQYPLWKMVYAHNVYSINEFEVAMAYWLIDNTETWDIIGTTDIGAPAFIGNRYLVDTFGLINPEKREFNGTHAEYLRYRNVTYFIDYPAHVHHKVADNCTIVYNTTYLPQVTITAGNQMAIYYCSWI